MRRRAFCALGLASIVASVTGVSTAVARDRAYRFLLDESFLWVDKKGAARFVAVAKEAGFNALVPCVWHGRGVTWSSPQFREPKWADNPNGLLDPLGNLIREAHAAGLEVHPWFTVALRQRDFLRNFWDKGTPDQAFDVHNAAFRNFITDLIVDVAARYEVDGINLDYIRSKGVCNSAWCQSDYKRATGRNLSVDDLSGGLLPGAEAAIGDWNVAVVSELVANISAGVRKVRPGTVMTVCSHAGMPEVRVQGADSIAWANAGLIDYILHIEYARVGMMRMKLLDTALRELNDPAKLIMIAGNYEADRQDKSIVWPRAPADVADALRFAGSFNKAQQSLALYTYQYLTPEQVAAVQKVLLPRSY